MSVIRVKKDENYTVMSNIHLNDKTISLKAKGLLSVILSLKPTWNYSIEGLVGICMESRTSVVNALNELKKHGYVKVTKLMPNETESGRIEYVYDIYEKPQNVEKQGIEKQGIENLGLEFLGVEKQDIENQLQLNTNKLNTNKLNTNKLNTNELEGKQHAKRKSSKFVAPTVEEVKAYCDERNNGIDAQRFVDYYQARGWMTGKNRIKDWKACVRTWERNSYGNTTRKKKTNNDSKEVSYYDSNGNFDYDAYCKANGYND